MVKRFKLLSMSFHDRSRNLGFMLLWLVASGYPQAAGAEPEAPALQSRTAESLSGEPAVALPGGLVELGPGPDLQPSDGASTESFSQATPRVAIGDNAEVQRFLEHFQTGYRRAVVERWIERSGRYAGMIQGVLRSKGLPEDLMFTAMIESGFNPVAVSRAGAKGLWQFMARTARLYGLRVDRWVDERFDPEKSTAAAASYLRDLRVRYGSWHLAQAAYNAGSVAVDRAVRATGSADFWALARTRFLKRETKDFVPAIQAAVLIGRDPGQYGFEVSGTTMTPDLERVVVPPGTDLRKLSASTGIAVQTLRSLNPVLIRGVTPPGTKWEVRVPAGTREGILAVLAPRKKLAAVNGGRRHTAGEVDLHIVRPRDTVSAIAKLYGVSIGNVVRWNNLENED